MLFQSPAGLLFVSGWKPDTPRNFLFHAEGAELKHAENTEKVRFAVFVKNVVSNVNIHLFKQRKLFYF